MADYQIAVLHGDNSDIILKKKIHIENILTSRIMVKKANKKAGVSKER